MFEGCPLILVPLDGTETADEARDKVLAALLGMGYTAFINPAGKLEVCTDCKGKTPIAVSEFGLVGGLPMLLGVVTCPEFPPVPVRDETWGSLKYLYSDSPESQ